ncbi:MAG: hypothetical protein QXD89_02970 [Candidatus Aenigmatarchaeota archaeon]
MSSKNSELLYHFLEREGVALPSILMKNKTIEELGKALKEPYLLSKFFRRMANNLSEYLKEDVLRNFQNEVEMIKTIFKDYSLSEEDIEIINFLIKETKTLRLKKYFYYLQIFGPLIYACEILKETFNKNLPKTIIVFIYTNLYVTFYEVVLHIVDRNLYEIINNKEEWKKENRDFLEKINRKEYNEHATSGEICKVLKKLRLKTENSIFGEKSEARIFRNKISHANIFYDKEEDKIIIGKERYDFQEFEKLFLRLFFFLVKWIENSLNIEKFSEFNKVISKEFKRFFIELSQFFLKVGRSDGELKYNYYNCVLKLKNEVG